jgi:hypothetical protein
MIRPNDAGNDSSSDDLNGGAARSGWGRLEPSEFQQ